MGLANPLWGAPRIHGELLMLGIEIAQLTVAKYMVPRLQTATIPELEDFPAQPCRGHCFDRPVHRTDRVLQTAPFTLTERNVERLIG